MLWLALQVKDAAGPIPNQPAFNYAYYNLTKVGRAKLGALPTGHFPSGCLYFRRHRENGRCAYVPLYTSVPLLCTFVYLCAPLCTFVWTTQTYTSIPLGPSVYLCVPLWTSVYLCVPLHTFVAPLTLPQREGVSCGCEPLVRCSSSHSLLVPCRVWETCAPWPLALVLPLLPALPEERAMWVALSCAV